MKSLLAVLFVLIATQSGGADLEIVSAHYGAKSSWVDVTSKVRTLVQAGTLTVKSETSLAGSDPIFGEVKELRVVYRVGGRQSEASIREGETATIPIPTQPPASAPFTPSTPAGPPTQQPQTAQTSTEPTQNLSKPEDWVAGLPQNAVSSYLNARTVSADKVMKQSEGGARGALRATESVGKDRVVAMRSWLSVWKNRMRDPNKALVELDYAAVLVGLNLDLGDEKGVNLDLNRLTAEYRATHHGNSPLWALGGGGIGGPRSINIPSSGAERSQMISNLKDARATITAVRMRNLTHPKVLRALQQLQEPVDSALKSVKQ